MIGYWDLEKGVVLACGWRLQLSIPWSYLQKRSWLDHMTAFLLVNILYGILQSTTQFLYSTNYWCKSNLTAWLLNQHGFHTLLIRFLEVLLLVWKKTTFSPEHVCESDRGACVCTQLFSLACHLVEIDGEKCPIKRKPVWWLSGNSMRLPVTDVECNTHITWKGQFGVWMNLSSRMKPRGRLLTVERQ